MAAMSPVSAGTAAGLSFSEVMVEGDGRRRRGLLAKPDGVIETGRERLERIRAGDRGSTLDDQIVETVTSWPDPIDVVLFCACHGDPERSWGFSPELDEEETAQLGFEMVRTQLALYRRLVQQGVFALVGTEMGEREYEAFRKGAERLAEELEARIRDADEGEAADARLELWLLDHLALWTPHKLDDVLADDLPKVLTVLDRRKQQLESLREALPSA